ncbi:MAG: cupin domain-containing protein [bacterium]|nr:cupin domain-containing protein [bacterium]
MSEKEILIQELVSDTKCWDGNPIVYPKEEPKITVLKITIPQNAKLPLHYHAGPSAAYVVKGELKVVLESGETRIFKEGDALIEVINVWHRGIGLADKTELIAFYASDTNTPLSTKKDGSLAYGPKG